MTNQVCMSDAVKCKEAKTHWTIQIPFSSEACFLPQLCLAFLWICFLPPSPLSAYTLPVWNLYGRAALACCLSELAFGGKLLVCELETGAMGGIEKWSHGEDIEKARFTFFPSSSGLKDSNICSKNNKIKYWRLEPWGGYRNGQILIFSLLKWFECNTIWRF